MDGQRLALVVAVDRYDSPALQTLAAPAADAEALAEVLGDRHLGGFDVAVLHNPSSWVLHQRVEDLLADCRADDLVLLHFSGHGLKDLSGELYLAATNTAPARLASTAVEAVWINRVMQRSRAQRIVLLLDCCYGGAFERGVVARAGTDVDVGDQFRQPSLSEGRGRAVITASTAMEYAFEGERLAAGAQVGPSVFTGALVEGIRTGAADRDQDGRISLGELYDYVHDRVLERSPHQTPCKWEFGLRGGLYIARNPHRRRPPALPPELLSLVGHPASAGRLAAVGELERLAGAAPEGIAGPASTAAALAALGQLAADDSRRVSAAAAEALTRLTPEPAPAAHVPEQPGVGRPPVTEQGPREETPPAPNDATGSDATGDDATGSDATGDEGAGDDATSRAAAGNDAVVVGQPVAGAAAGDGAVAPPRPVLPGRVPDTPSAGARRLAFLHAALPRSALGRAAGAGLLAVVLTVVIAVLLNEAPNGSRAQAPTASTASTAPAVSPSGSTAAAVKSFSVEAVEFSPDGRTLATAGNDGTVRLWDPATGRLLRNLVTHTGEATGVAVAFSPDSDLLATCGLDQAIRLWARSTGKTVKSFPVGAALIHSLQFGPKGRVLAANGLAEDAASLWDTATGKATSFSGHRSPFVTRVALSPNGKTIASAGHGLIEVWATDTHRFTRILRGHTDIVMDLAFSPDGRTLASSGRDPATRLWDMDTGKAIVLEGHEGTHSGVAFSPDGRTVLTGSYDGTARLWNRQTGKTVRTFDGDAYALYSVAFSPDGRTVATGDDVGAVTLWNVADGKIRRTLRTGS